MVLSKSTNSLEVMTKPLRDKKSNCFDLLTDILGSFLSLSKG